MQELSTKFCGMKFAPYEINSESNDTFNSTFKDQRSLSETSPVFDYARENTPNSNGLSKSTVSSCQEAKPESLKELSK